MARPLKSLELAQSATEGAFEGGFEAEQAIESGGIRYTATEYLQLNSRPLESGEYLPVAFQATNFFIDLPYLLPMAM